MTFITNLANAGVSPKAAQTLARHSDIRLTMHTYTSIELVEQAAAVERLPAIPQLKSPTVARGDSTPEPSAKVNGPKFFVPQLVSSQTLAYQRLAYCV